MFRQVVLDTNLAEALGIDEKRHHSCSLTRNRDLSLLF